MCLTRARRSSSTTTARTVGLPSVTVAAQALGNRRSEVGKRERAGQPRAPLDPVEIAVGIADAHDLHAGLDRAQLADQRLGPLFEQDADDQDVDLDSARELDRFERM